MFSCVLHNPSSVPVPSEVRNASMHTPGLWSFSTCSTMSTQLNSSSLLVVHYSFLKPPSVICHNVHSSIPAPYTSGMIAAPCITTVPSHPNMGQCTTTAGKPHITKTRPGTSSHTFVITTLLHPFPSRSDLCPIRSLSFHATKIHSLEHGRAKGPGGWQVKPREGVMGRRTVTMGSRKVTSGGWGMQDHGGSHATVV